MVVRTEGGEWTVLSTAANNDAYSLGENDSFVWMDGSFTRLLVATPQPGAPEGAAQESNRTAPIAARLSVGAYAGAPLLRADGSMFGVVCAIDPAPRPPPSDADHEMLRALARLLATILDGELRAGEEKRRAERAELEAMVDGLTGLWNRRAWEQLKAKEEARCRRYGNPACVISVDLDGLKTVNDTQGHKAGDGLLLRAARALRATTRAQDIVARMGGDEFAILAVECDEPHGHELVERLRGALAAENVSASVGIAARRSSATIDAAWDEADREMYRSKNLRRSIRPE